VSSRAASSRGWVGRSSRRRSKPRWASEEGGEGGPPRLRRVRVGEWSSQLRKRRENGDGQRHLGARPNTRPRVMGRQRMSRSTVDAEHGGSSTTARALTSPKRGAWKPRSDGLPGPSFRHLRRRNIDVLRVTIAKHEPAFRSRFCRGCIEASCSRGTLRRPSSSASSRSKSAGEDMWRM
jgi:hypothetical protein